GITSGTNGMGPHSDSHAMDFDAGGKLLEGDDGGIFRLDNALQASLSWSDLNGDLATIQFYGIALDPTNSHIVYGGSQDNGTEKYTGTSAWTMIAGGDGSLVRVDQSN